MEYIPHGVGAKGSLEKCDKRIAKRTKVIRIYLYHPTNNYMVTGILRCPPPPSPARPSRQKIPYMLFVTW